jgi:hypothetical protein
LSSSSPGIAGRQAEDSYNDEDDSTAEYPDDDSFDDESDDDVDEADGP